MANKGTVGNVVLLLLLFFLIIIWMLEMYRTSGESFW